MKVGDIGKVGTNLAYRIGTIEYIHEDSLVVKYKDNSREKIAIEDFIPFNKTKEDIAVITSTEFDNAVKKAMKSDRFVENLKAQLFSKHSDKINLWKGWYLWILENM